MLRDDIGTICARFNVDPILTQAIITVESAWNPYAIRYEANWRHLLKEKEFAAAHGITLLTETMLQKCSFGLMQIIGARALELGLKSPLPTLFDAKINIEYGCRVIADIKRRYSNRDEIIAAYNAGTAKRAADGSFLNQAYVSKVNVEIDSLRRSANVL